jgi:hypothetical protein
MMARKYHINPAVNHERLDDEVIAINLDTGVYFAMDDTAADCWSVLAAAGTIDDMVALLVARFEVESDVARRDVEAFSESVVTNGLAMAVEATEAGAVSSDVAPVGSVRLPYVAPVLQGYDDLETLLLIDPIHEVDDAGWPMPLPQADA